MDLNTTWFLLIGVLVGGYAILDGFDLGVGVLHLFAKSETERRLHINAIGPVWDGNEVWLLTAGGALFAAFPQVYATVFSGFYLAIVLLLVGLIFRAVAMEFRGKVDSPGWRKAWDVAFGFGSLIPAILLGVAFGNIMRGIPIGDDRLYAGTFFMLLNPYSVLAGVLSLALFVMHGAIYMVCKTEGELANRMRRVASGAWMAVVVLFLAQMLATFFWAHDRFAAGFGQPLFWVFIVLILAASVYLPVALTGGRPLKAFLASASVILGCVGAAAACLFPNLVPSLTMGNANALTIYNASSTDRTLKTMLVIALVGMPIVLAYTAFIYWTFRGKVRLGEESY